jgi:hypothetical protein
MSQMKKLLESLDQINECPPMEAGAMPPAAPMDQGDPVRMNVNISAAGKDHVADLIDMMKNAGLGDAKPAADAMMPMRMDMERLRDVVDGPREGLDEDDNPEMMSKLQAIADGPDGEEELVMRMDLGVGDEGMYLRKMYDKVSNKMFSKGYGDLDDPEDFDKVHAEVMQMFGIKAVPLKDLQKQEGYDNEPDPEYQDHKYMTKDLSGGINREKKAYAKAQDGDNAMAVEAIKAQLMAALSEKKAKPDFLDMDGDGNKKEPMKKAIKDKKAKK